MGFSEHMYEGIVTTVIGMGVVFFILIVLSFCIHGLNYLVDKVIEKKKHVESREDVPPKGELKAAGSPGRNLPQDSKLPAITAVVAASLSAFYGNTSKDFIIKEIRCVEK